MSPYDHSAIPAPFLSSPPSETQTAWDYLPANWKIVEDPSWSKLSAVADAGQEVAARPFAVSTWSWPSLETVHHAWDIQ